MMRWAGLGRVGMAAAVLLASACGPMSLGGVRSGGGVERSGNRPVADVTLCLMHGINDLWPDNKTTPTTRDPGRFMEIRSYPPKSMAQMDALIDIRAVDERETVVQVFVPEGHPDRAATFEAFVVLAETCLEEPPL